MGRQQDDSLSRLTIDVPDTDDSREWMTRLKDALLARFRQGRRRASGSHLALPQPGEV